MHQCHTTTRKWQPKTWFVYEGYIKCNLHHFISPAILVSESFAISVLTWNSEYYRCLLSTLDLLTTVTLSTTVWVKKKSPPYGFLKFFPKRLWIFNQFLHTYYTIIFTLEYKFLFKYLQLWQSYCDDSRSFNRSFSVQISEGTFLLRAH